MMLLLQTGPSSPSVLKSPPSPWKGALGGHLNITLRNYAQRRRRRCPGFAPHNLRYVQVPAQQRADMLVP